MIINKSQIKTAFLSAELAPIAKVGGLADVAGSLPKELANMGVDIAIFLPFYGLIDAKKYKIKKIREIKVPINDKNEPAEIWKTALPGTKIPVFLIKHNFFNSKQIYIQQTIMKNGKYTADINDIKRFTFFDQACLEAMKTLDFKPDIIHANDWHTALIGALIKKRQEIFFENTKILYTIHNLANQGIAKPDIVDFSRLNPDMPVIKTDLKNGDINFMVQGILGSDLVNTVSPTYAKEILAHYQGAGLDNILRQRKKDLYGIINGIDTDFFNPATDKLIKQKYSLKSPDKKTANKLYLQKKVGLPRDKNIAVVGIVSRLARQKGFDLITDEFAKLNCQFIILGTGQKEIEEQFKKLAKKYPDKFSANIVFDIKLAQQIYAGADIFLMPSLFEPCGLGQMIAMRYGTIPLVNKTGGLADTVLDFKYDIGQFKFNLPTKASGFVFKKFTVDSLQKTLTKALDIYYSRPKKWRKLQINGMKKDFSWRKSAQQYLHLYKKLV